MAEAPDYQIHEKSYTIKIEVLQARQSGCQPLGDSISYTVYNSCGSSWQLTATRPANSIGDSLSKLCIPKAKTGFGDIRAFTFTDTLRLDSGSTCRDLLVYYESPPIDYLNFDTVPVVSWVLLNTFIRNSPPQLDTNFRLLEACNQEKRYYKPAYGDTDGDSLLVSLSKAINYNPSTGSFPVRNDESLKFPYTSQTPLGANNFTINRRTMSFEPFDTGFYAVPVSIAEYKPSSNPFVGYVKAATSYFQIPVLISDECFPDLYFFGVFNDDDTLSTYCGSGVITVPLSTKVLTSSINPDGTDFKFSNANGYPVIVNRVIIPEDTLFTDKLKMDVSFFFDGDYKLAIVSGTDNNSVFNECGYELLESDYFNLHLYDCPNQVFIGLEENYNDFGVYPNPFKDKLVVNLGEAKPTDVRIYNSVGEEVELSFEILEKQLEILTEVPAGIYILSLQMKDGTHSTMRVIRQ